MLPLHQVTSTSTPLPAGGQPREAPPALSYTTVPGVTTWLCLKGAALLEKPPHPVSLAGRHSRNAVLSWTEQEGSRCQFLGQPQAWAVPKTDDISNGKSRVCWLCYSSYPGTFSPTSLLPRVQCRPQGQPVRWRLNSAQEKAVTGQQLRQH